MIGQLGVKQTPVVGASPYVHPDTVGAVHPAGDDRLSEITIVGWKVEIEIPPIHPLEEWIYGILEIPIRCGDQENRKQFGRIRDPFELYEVGTSTTGQTIA